MTDNKNSELSKIGLATIWAIGVGSALGGDFFGWQVIILLSLCRSKEVIIIQFVLYGGFGSATAATIFSALLYWLYAGMHL